MQTIVRGFSSLLIKNGVELKHGRKKTTKETNYFEIGALKLVAMRIQRPNGPYLPFPGGWCKY